MRQYDKNHNGKLEKDEWTDRWGDFKEADRNRDGVVKPDELSHRLAEYSRSRSSQYRSMSGRSYGSRSSDSGSSGSSRSGSGSDDSGDRKSYRFRTPTERLPEGLPDWFASKDANADGQVAMVEFESPGYWTATAAAQFARHDLNNDGFITAGECLRALELPEIESQVAKTEVRGPGLLSRVIQKPQPPEEDRRPPSSSGAVTRTVSVEKKDSGELWSGWDD